MLNLREYVACKFAAHVGHILPVRVEPDSRCDVPLEMLKLVLEGIEELRR
jgi:hypothetical protein